MFSWTCIDVFFQSKYFEHTSLYLNTFCLLCCVCVCVCPVFEKAGSYLSASFMRFPLNRFPLCHLSVCLCGKVCGRFHGTVPTLHSTSLHPFPPLHLFSLIYPSILFRPSVAAAPLFLSITPAVMRLNLSVSTGHAHAHTLYAQPPVCCSTHT